MSFVEEKVLPRVLRVLPHRRNPVLRHRPPDPTTAPAREVTLARQGVSEDERLDRSPHAVDTEPATAYRRRQDG